MIGDICDLSLDLSQLLAIELKTAVADFETDKIIFSLRPKPQYVFNPEQQAWHLVNDPVTLVQKFPNKGSAIFAYNNWLKTWNEYTESQTDFEIEEEK